MSEMLSIYFHQLFILTIVYKNCMYFWGIVWCFFTYIHGIMSKVNIPIFLSFNISLKWKHPKSFDVCVFSFSFFVVKFLCFIYIYTYIYKFCLRFDSYLTSLVYFCKCTVAFSTSPSIMVKKWTLSMKIILVCQYLSNPLVLIALDSHLLISFAYYCAVFR